jgi:NADP-dependent alcohol dehydrogenase
MIENFTYQNPVKVIFGSGSIASLSSEIPREARVLVTYGGGSIKLNGVYDQVAAALKDHAWLEFGGIEPNPTFETLMKAVEIVRREKITWLLAVGGGSVLDGTKFIAAAAVFPGDTWDILTKRPVLKAAVPIGTVLTLPATGSEMNGAAVISRQSTREKLVFIDPLAYPRFSVMDPQVTYSLPPRQVINGIVYTFVHTTEQYLTHPVGAHLQDRQAEAILNTMVEIAPDLLKAKPDYDSRATFMWTATNALNNLIGCGVPQDWATHMIGHELTALYNLDHGQTLAIILPQVLNHQFERKKAKLAQMYHRVWEGRQIGDCQCQPIPANDLDAAARRCICCIETFFNSVGMPTTFAAYGVTAEPQVVAARLASRSMMLGEYGDIDPAKAAEIVALAMA